MAVVVRITEYYGRTCYESDICIQCAVRDATSISLLLDMQWATHTQTPFSANVHVQVGNISK